VAAGTLDGADTKYVDHGAQKSLNRDYIREKVSAVEWLKKVAEHVNGARASWSVWTGAMPRRSCHCVMLHHKPTYEGLS
jgi:hypothetical protein